MLFVSYPVSTLEALSSGLSPACSLTLQGAGLASDRKIILTYISPMAFLQEWVVHGGGGGCMSLSAHLGTYQVTYIVVVVSRYIHSYYTVTAVNKCAGT